MTERLAVWSVLALLGVAVSVTGAGWLGNDPGAAGASRPGGAGGVVAFGQVADPGPGEPDPDPDYRWPLPGPPPVTRGFDPPALPWLPGHRGVDLAAVPGTVVYAAGAGVVFFAGPVAGRDVISIDHPDGLRTTYEPVSATVAAGEAVAAGEPIGVLAPGHAGCPRAACLHWGLRQGWVYLDPLSLLGLGRVRLLPGPG